MKTFILTISSPDGDIFRGEVTKVSARGIDGDFAIMSGHIPFVTTIKPGKCNVEFENGEEKTGVCDGGILNAKKDGVTILSGSFKWE